MKPEKGDYDLWYAGTVGFATKEEAQAHIDRGNRHPHEVQHDEMLKNMEAADLAKKNKTTMWLLFTLVSAVIFAVLFAIRFNSNDDGRRQMLSQALSSCQKVILSLAKYGDAERPPYRTPEATGRVVSYSWEKGSFHFKNGFGVKVPQSAVCMVSEGEVVFLKFNDEVLLSK